MEGVPRNPQLGRPTRPAGRPPAQRNPPLRPLRRRRLQIIRRRHRHVSLPKGHIAGPRRLPGLRVPPHTEPPRHVIHPAATNLVGKDSNLDRVRGSLSGQGRDLPPWEKGHRRRLARDCHVSRVGRKPPG
ncbi:hypothetical protein LINGRAHAP2_LOCUS15565 [Linum grandiflorum]